MASTRPWRTELQTYVRNHVAGVRMIVLREPRALADEDFDGLRERTKLGWGLQRQHGKYRGRALTPPVGGEYGGQFGWWLRTAWAEVVGTPGPLAPGVDLTAYRIVQEALTNTIRHARADRAAVTLCYEPGYITVSVTDSGPRRDGPARGQSRRNGNGSAAVRPGSLVAGSGLGLAGIAERVASCGGNLTVGPTQSGGFAVTARLPAL